MRLIITPAEPGTPDYSFKLNPAAKPIPTFDLICRVGAHWGHPALEGNIPLSSSGAYASWHPLSCGHPGRLNCTSIPNVIHHDTQAAQAPRTHRRKRGPVIHPDNLGKPVFPKHIATTHAIGPAGSVCLVATLRAVGTADTGLSTDQLTRSRDHDLSPLRWRCEPPLEIHAMEPTWVAALRLPSGPCVPP